MRKKIEPEYFLVCGRLAHRFNQTAVIAVALDSKRDAWEIFVEEILYNGSPPSGWQASDDSEVYQNIVAKIPGPLLPHAMTNLNPFE